MAIARRAHTPIFPRKLAVARNYSSITGKNNFAIFVTNNTRVFNCSVVV
jgi:hypothetical protein